MRTVVVATATLMLFGCLSKNLDTDLKCEIMCEDCGKVKVSCEYETKIDTTEVKA